MIKANVFITTKEDVIDAQGQATEAALRKLGHDNVSKVRIGKTIAIDLDTGDLAAAEQLIHQMCDQLLVNKVVEQYDIQLSLVSDSQADVKEGL